MNMEKISIIIPVYKVERYLDRCIESVLQQSYSNLEVLLIDDGSPDNCGRLCDQWAEKDTRIRVIHKENGGLSDARNIGLVSATGDYIVFVDSDDFIAPDMVQNLYDALNLNAADMSICNIHYVDENGNSLPGNNKYSPIRDEVITGFEAINRESDYYHKGWYYLFAWNKLYKKSAFSEIRFPKGKLSEDDFVAHKLFRNCSKIACISTIGYYYVQRAGSILSNENSKLCLHQAEARLDRALCCNELGLFRSAGLSYWIAAMALPSACKKDSSSFALQEELEDTTRLFRQNIQLRKFCKLKERFQVLLVFISPTLYRALFRNSFKRRLVAFIRRSSQKQYSEGKG